MSERSEQRSRRHFHFPGGVQPTYSRRAADYWKAQSERHKPVGMDRTERALVAFVIFVLGCVALAALRMALQ